MAETDDEVAEALANIRVEHGWSHDVISSRISALTSRVEALEAERLAERIVANRDITHWTEVAADYACKLAIAESDLARLTEENQQLRTDRPTYCGTCLSFEQRATLGLIGHYLTGGEDGLPLDWNAMLGAARTVADTRRDALASSSGEPAHG